MNGVAVLLCNLIYIIYFTVNVIQQPLLEVQIGLWAVTLYALYIGIRAQSTLGGTQHA